MRDAAHGGVLMNGAFDGQTFFAVVNHGVALQSQLYAMNASDGTDLWPPKMFAQATWGAPAIANGVLFVPINDDLLILNAATGDQLNMFNTGGTVAAASPAVAAGKVVVPSGLQYPLATDAKNNNLVLCYGLP